jgi:hypothetical protein
MARLEAAAPAVIAVTVERERTKALSAMVSQQLDELRDAMRERIARLEGERDDAIWQFERASRPDPEELRDRAARVAAEFGVDLRA